MSTVSKKGGSTRKGSHGGSSMGLRVGVTLFIRDEHQSVWENGIFQNCFFLLDLLNASPLVSQAFIVAGGPCPPDAARALLEHAPARVIDLYEAQQALDVVIELSAQLDPQWALHFAGHGGRIIGMRVANDFIIDAERIAYNLDPGLLMSGVPYDEIWTLDAFEATCASYYEIGYRAPVRVMPHLWSPRILERAHALSGTPHPFRYEPGRKRWRLAIMEPNICTVKTCHLPLVLADIAHRKMPTCIEYLRVYNALKLKEHRDFVAFAKSTDLVRQGLATFEGRFPVYQVLGPEADALISHQWNNARNYLYYEALYGGYPLIHNSPILSDCGYYYSGFDAHDGALALVEAMQSHDRHLDAYQSRAAAFLDTLSPLSAQNITLFEAALVGTVGNRAARS